MKKWLCLVCFLVLAGCGQQEATYQPQFVEKGQASGKEYIVGIHPLHNPQRLLELYGPIVDAFNTALPQTHFVLEASRSYEDFDNKLFARHFDFAMPNPYQTVRAMASGYQVFAKMGDDADFRGIILVRQDSHIRSVADLKGKKVAYPAPTALAATLMPQYYLHTHGLDVNHDVENLYVGSQESSIMNVVLGHTAAAATWPVPWKIFVQEQPALAAQLEIKWQTDTLPNNGWVARNDVPAEVREKVSAVLLGLQTSEAGRKILAHLPISQFETASAQTYLPVRNYLAKFSRDVRPLPW